VFFPQGPGQATVHALFASSIAAGDAEEAWASTPASQGWAGSQGYVTYFDLDGREWVTHMRFTAVQGGLSGEHTAPVLVTDANDPRAEYPAADWDARWPPRL
jgi:hypothetical protein